METQTAFSLANLRQYERYSCIWTKSHTQAFKIMCENKVGGIGVVNSVGVLVGGISIRAMANFTEGNLTENLNTLAGDFLKRKEIEGCDVDVLGVR